VERARAGCGRGHCLHCQLPLLVQTGVVCLLSPWEASVITDVVRVGLVARAAPEEMSAAGTARTNNFYPDGVTVGRVQLQPLMSVQYCMRKCMIDMLQPERQLRANP